MVQTVDDVKKYAKILLTLMTGCPEFKYWEKDNDKLILPERKLSNWIATIHALEAMINDIESE